jgi:hypothetical protein
MQYINKFYELNKNFLVDRPNMESYTQIYKYMMFESICLVFRDYQEILQDALDYQECLDLFYGRVLNGGLIRSFKWIVTWNDDLESVLADPSNFNSKIVGFDEQYGFINIMDTYNPIEGGTDAIQAFILEYTQ